MSWLLDTCAISEYAKKTPSPDVIAWLDEQDETSLFISVITLGELEKGILKLRTREPQRSQKLTAWLAKVEQRFAGRILPLDASVLHAWAQLSAQAELAGETAANHGWPDHGDGAMPSPDRGHPQPAGFRALPGGLQSLGAVTRYRNSPADAR